MQLFNEIADFNGNVLMKCWWCPLLLRSKLKHGLYSHQTCSSFENGAFISIQIVLQFDFLVFSCLPFFLLTTTISTPGSMSVNGWPIQLLLKVTLMYCALLSFLAVLVQALLFVTFHIILCHLMVTLQIYLSGI